MSACLSAFGVKRTCRELGRQIDRSQMTDPVEKGLVNIDES
jgi:hypothetical protein